MKQIFSRQTISLSAPLKMKRLLMFSVPSLVVLGLLTLTGWRWWRKRVQRTRSASSVGNQGHTRALVTAQISPSISEDSGVVDAQVDDSKKISSECGSKVSRARSSKGHWKYPTASSDVRSETLSEVGSSLSSSEEVFAEPQNFELSTFSHGEKKIGASKSASHVGAEGSTEHVQKSLSTPALGTAGWANRKRVMVQLPRDMVGRFIGKQGRNIKSLMAEADGAHVYVNQKNLPKDALIVPCTVQGTCEQVEMALKVIEMRYPELDLPSQLEKSVSQQQPFPSPLFGTPRLNGESWDSTLSAAQVPASPFKAMVTYIESLSRLWIVPYDKSAELDDQHQSMSYTYCYAAATGNDTMYASEGDESLLKKFCAVRVSDIHWLRGQMAKLNEEGGNYEVLLVDYGSTVIVPHTAIRPLRREHTSLPIQAFPCELASVIPNDALSEDGLVSLQALVEGMVLEVHITGDTSTPPSPNIKPTIPGETFDKAEPQVGVVKPLVGVAKPSDEPSVSGADKAGAASEDKSGESVLTKWFHIEPAPLVELYTRFGSDSPLFINRELVDRGYAIWREGPMANES